MHAVGIPTLSRPANLAACARSFAENASSHGRRLEIVVIDVSRAVAVREENLARLRPLAGSAEIRYCGPEQAEAFSKQLEANGVSSGAIKLAFGSFSAPDNFGTARNLLMLDQAGEAFVSADDDVIARPAIHPALKPGIRAVGGGSCFDNWFFRDRAGALQWARWDATDIIGQHEALLGRSVASLMAGRCGPVHLDQVCGHFADSTWNGRVVGTMAGKIGDSGRADPDWDKLTGSWFAGRSELGRLEMAELPPSAAIGHHIGCMTTVVGLDLRSILPPFFPRHSGEDGMFSLVLGRLMPNACWGVVPHGIVHDRPPRGTGGPIPLLSPCDMLCAQLSSLPQPCDGRSGEEAIREAGAGLCRAVDTGPCELQQSTIERVAAKVSQSGARIRRFLEGDVPPDQRAAMEGACERAERELARLCDPIAEAPVDGYSWHDLGRELREYGQLLQRWPELFQAARELRASGVRLSAPLKEARAARI